MGVVASKEKETTKPSCSICLDAIDKGTTLSCQHTFHEGCIDTWFKHKSSCPLCRKEEPKESESVTLHVDWVRTGGTWRRRIRVTPELIWSPADGPMPDSLRTWRERHSL